MSALVIARHGGRAALVLEHIDGSDRLLGTLAIEWVEVFRVAVMLAASVPRGRWIEVVSAGMHTLGIEGKSPRVADRLRP
jgi:hypothetical protein